MAEVVRHNCGLTVAHSLHDAYRFIHSLQHRGREAAGIAAVGDGRIDVIKWKGGVSRFDVTDLHKIFLSPNYHTYMAHVRYATRGSKGQNPRGSASARHRRFGRTPRQSHPDLGLRCGGRPQRPS